MSQRLIPLTDEAGLKEAGLPFCSTWSARWCLRHAEERGLSDAFVRVGGRVFIDPDIFHKRIRETQAS